MPNLSKIEPITHTIDADGQILGRLATNVANLLRGKGKVGFTYHQDHGDRVVVLNADKVRTTGRKLSQKTYYRHSGYPGALTEISLAKLQLIHPERVIEQAVKNMLPNTRLRPHWLKHLSIKTSEKNA